MSVTYTETIAVYRPTQQVNSDLSVSPTAVAYVDTIPMNLHRGTEHSRSTVNNLGIYNVTTGYAFTSIDNASKIGDRYVLADQLGQYWVVHGVPAYRSRFAQTAHLRAAITLLKIKPLGIP